MLKYYLQIYFVRVIRWKENNEVERTSLEVMIPMLICMKYFQITCQKEMLDVGLLNRYFYKKLHIFSYLTESTHILFTKKPKQSSGKQTPTPPFRTPFISQIFPHKSLSCKMITARIVMHMPPTVCWNRVLRGHFLGIKMHHWNKCLSSFL